MTSEGLGDMFEGDSSDMCAGKFPLVLKGGRAEGLASADPGPRTPIGASGNLPPSLFKTVLRSACREISPPSVSLALSTSESIDIIKNKLKSFQIKKCLKIETKLI